MTNPNPKSSVPAPAPKRRGRPRGHAPVTLTVTVDAEPGMLSRIENMIDDLPQAATVTNRNVSETGFSITCKYATGPEGRLARRGIVQSLSKYKGKGRIRGAVIASNVITV